MTSRLGRQLRRDRLDPAVLDRQIGLHDAVGRDQQAAANHARHARSRSQCVEPVHADLEGGGDVVLQHPLVGMMADPAGTPQEQHRRRHPSRDDHRVVSGAAGHAMHRPSGRGDGTREGVRERRRHRHGGLIELLCVRERRARAGPRSPARSASSAVHRLPPLRVVGVPHVEAGDDATVDGVAGVGRGLQPADGRDEARRGDREPVPPRRPTRPPPASASRRDAIGVVPAWLAWPVKTSSTRDWPAMASTTPRGAASCVEHGPLLDVELEVRRAQPATRCALSSCVGVQAVGLQRGPRPTHHARPCRPARPRHRRPARGCR